MIFIAEINVLPLKELLDPQGKAVKRGLNNLGLQHVQDVRIGKHITIKIEAEDEKQAGEIIREACKKLLANPVMEYFEFTIHK